MKRQGNIVLLNVIIPFFIFFILLVESKAPRQQLLSEIKEGRKVSKGHVAQKFKAKGMSLILNLLRHNRVVFI